MITDYLLRRIITTTSRARYYSFYPWALWHIEKNEAPARFSEFAAAFRRREAFAAFATLQNDANAGRVVGARSILPKLAQSSERRVIDTNVAVLPSNGMGGYGQYYGGCLYGFGLTYRSEEGIDRTAPGRGEAIANAFERSVAETPYLKQAHYRDNTIPLGVLVESAEIFSLDSLNQEGAVVERELLRELFFSWDRTELRETDILRRQTLGLILHMVSEYERAGIKSTEVEKHLVYPTYYYGVLWHDEEPVPYQPPANLATCYGFWQQFCAHEYLTQALETLLWCILEVLNLQPSGMTLADIFRALTEQGFGSTLSRVFGAGSTPSELLAALGINTIPDGEQCQQARAQIGATSDKSEWKLLAVEGGPAETAAAAVGLLAVLYAKWRGAGSEFTRYIGLHASGELWTGAVLPAMDEWLRPDLDWNTALNSFLEPFLLEQHDRIMYEKGRLESCWLSRLDGKIRKDQDYHPVFRSSRHWNCVQILTDVGLLEISPDDELSITAEGRRQLNRVLHFNGT